MADIMKPEESINDFLNRMRELWGQENRQQWANTGPKVAFFYNILKKGLPTKIQSGLDSVVGLDTKPWQEIQANILHYHKKKPENDREKQEQTQN